MSTAVMIHQRGAPSGVGRLIGILLLAHLTGGLVVPFIMLHPLVSPPGFLVSAAGVDSGPRGRAAFFRRKRDGYRGRERGMACVSSVQLGNGALAGGPRGGSIFVAGGG